MIGKVVKFPRFKTVAAPTGPVARVDIYIQRYFAERFFAITHVDQVCAVIDLFLMIELPVNLDGYWTASDVLRPSAVYTQLHFLGK